MIRSHYWTLRKSVNLISDVTTFIISIISWCLQMKEAIKTWNNNLITEHNDLLTDPKKYVQTFWGQFILY